MRCNLRYLNLPECIARPSEKAAQEEARKRASRRKGTKRKGQGQKEKILAKEEQRKKQIADEKEAYRLALIRDKQDGL